MVYLLDANVLITAHTTYYPLDAVPEFWTWLTHQCGEGNIKMPIDTYEEVKDGGTDEEQSPLYAWVRHEANRAVLLLNGEADGDLVRRVLRDGYADDLSDNEVEGLGRDPFLIAHALADTVNRCVVTTEVSKPTKTRQNRRIPDACASLGVRCCDPFALLRTLRFSTDWSRRG